VGLWWWATHEPAGTDGSSTSARETSTSSGASSHRTRDASGLPAIAVDELPPEARTTLDLIDAGGPFPYDRDGVVFQNRERILPARSRGYYHEYTVPTPGEDDRGARRIVTGGQGERYWTADHYDSFHVVTEEP
jgi:ribonuclease T1